MLPQLRYKRDEENSILWVRKSCATILQPFYYHLLFTLKKGKKVEKSVMRKVWLEYYFQRLGNEIKPTKLTSGTKKESYFCTIYTSLSLHFWEIFGHTSPNTHEAKHRGFFSVLL